MPVQQDCDYDDKPDHYGVPLSDIRNQADCVRETSLNSPFNGQACATLRYRVLFAHIQAERCGCDTLLSSKSEVRLLIILPHIPVLIFITYCQIVENAPVKSSVALLV